MTASQIAEQTGQQRSSVYYVLDQLTTNGLILKNKEEGSKTYFSAEHPSVLKRYIEQRRQRIEQSGKQLDAVMNNIVSTYNLAYEKPGITFFEGEEGLKRVFEDIYANDKDEVIGCVDLEKLEEAFPSELQKTLIPKRVRGKLHATTLLVDSPAAKQTKDRDHLENRSSVLVDGKRFPLPAEIDIYKNKVAMLSFEKGSFVGVVIENESIATTLRSIFQMAWESNAKE